MLSKPAPTAAVATPAPAPAPAPAPVAKEQTAPPTRPSRKILSDDEDETPKPVVAKTKKQTDADKEKTDNDDDDEEEEEEDEEEDEDEDDEGDDDEAEEDDGDEGGEGEDGDDEDNEHGGSVFIDGSASSKKRKLSTSRSSDVAARALASDDESVTAASKAKPRPKPKAAPKPKANSHKAKDTAVAPDPKKEEEEKKAKELERAPFRNRGVLKHDLTQTKSKLYEKSAAFWAARMKPVLADAAPGSVDFDNAHQVFATMFAHQALQDELISKAKTASEVFVRLAEIFDQPWKAYLLRNISPMNVPRGSCIHQPQIDLLVNNWDADKGVPLTAVPRRIPDHPIFAAAAALANVDMGTGVEPRPKITSFFNAQGLLGDIHILLKLMLLCRWIVEGTESNRLAFLASVRPVAAAAAVVDI